MPFVDRISSLDSGYTTGNLSIYPEAKDNNDSLYRVTNNAETVLTQTFSYTSRFLVVADTSKFPSSGLLRVGTEIIYYQTKTSTTFQNIKRGFAKTGQNVWQKGTKVSGAVMAESHNAVRDAIINIETNLGLAENPSETSLHGILQELEYAFLAPKPVFRGAPRKGPPSLTVHFHNFSDAPPIRFLWDFGDGSTSVESSPTHTYLASGRYTVRLSMITSLGATGIATKSDYIVVDESENIPFFYSSSLVGTTSTTFTLIDQSKGDIASRYWIWDDGTKEAVLDPDIHTATHQYTSAGQYEPNLLLVFADGSLQRVILGDKITVTE